MVLREEAMIADFDTIPGNPEAYYDADTTARKVN
jgi:hypothetical protein